MSVGRGIIGFDRDGALQQNAGLDVSRPRVQPHLLAPAQKEIVGIEVDGALFDQAVLLIDAEIELERRDDLLREFVLDGEDVVKIAIEAFGPDMAAGRRIDQLRVDPDPIGRPAHASFEHIANASAFATSGIDTALRL